MARATMLLISVLLGSFLVAQPSADLTTTVAAPDEVPPGETFTVTGTVTNLGPIPAEHVLVTLVGSGTSCVHERDVGTLEQGETRTFVCETQMPLPPLYGTWAAMVAQTATDDPREENNQAAHFVRSITAPDLYNYAQFPEIPRPALPVPLVIYFGNRAQQPATGVTVTITTPTRVTKAPDTCTITESRAVCSVGTLEPNDPWGGSSNMQHFQVEIEAPAESVARLDVTVVIDAAEDDARPENNQYATYATTYRTFYVTMTADSGVGSLRAAMEKVNAECADTIPCLIAFRIPSGGATAAAWHTIKPTSPLPRLVQKVVIDGTSQTAYIADTNLAGPEIELSGAGLREGNGLELACTGAVRGLAINGFPDNGVRVVESVCGPAEPFATRSIDRNYIGTDPTGTRAIPNLRGIWVAAPRWSIRGNVISGNTHSGVFVANGRTKITENKIGLDPALRPLGNGASGVGIVREGSGSDVSLNYIGFNRHFGVAIAPDAQYVSVEKNSIQANHQRGIDWGIDGVTTVKPVAMPEITSVRVENGTTIIEGTHAAFGTFPPHITVYANDAPDPSGYGEGQYVLGTVTAPTREWKLVWPEDLRGKWVTATATHQLYLGWLRDEAAKPNEDDGFAYYTTTSELSRAIEVQ
jgi:hypothetical protein